MSRYKADWKAGERNQPFWEEVLKGRRINDLVWDADGIHALVLDDGNSIYLPTHAHCPRLTIQDTTNEEEE